MCICKERIDKQWTWLWCVLEARAAQCKCSHSLFVIFQLASSLLHNGHIGNWSDTSYSWQTHPFLFLIVVGFFFLLLLLIDQFPFQPPLFVMTVLTWSNETTACSLSKQGCIRKNSQNWKTWCFAGEYRITARSVYFTYPIQASNTAQGVHSWHLGIQSRNIFMLSWYGMVLEMLFSFTVAT